MYEGSFNYLIKLLFQTLNQITEKIKPSETASLLNPWNLKRSRKKQDGEKYDVKQTLFCLPLQSRLGRTQVSGLKSILSYITRQIRPLIIVATLSKTDEQRNKPEKSWPMVKMKATTQLPRTAICCMHTKNIIKRKTLNHTFTEFIKT